MSIFAVRLREARQRKGWTANQMADKVGIATNSIYNYERGKGEPTMFALTLLADTLGVTTDWLTGREGKMYRIIIDVTTKNIQGVKECLAMQMERFGDMMVVEVKEIPEYGDQLTMKGSETV
jgi:transcriptional regulator with XRE-family HTH domain